MQSSGIEGAAPEAAAPAVAERPLLSFADPRQHLRLTAVEFRDSTDDHNELVFEREWLLHPAERSLELAGNLFVIEDTLTGSGRVLLKTLPLPHARPHASAADLRVAPGKEGGFVFTLVTSDPAEAADTLVDLTYEGGEAGRLAALQAFQGRLRPDAASHRVPRFLSNTWGDRNRDSRICEAFLMQEIEAGSRLGVDVVQIDDGWQAGTTANSIHARTHGGVWEGYWQTDPGFWKPHPERLPAGLAPLASAAAANGMQLGLWYSPDSSHSFRQWERDADMLLALHREHGIEHFKIDGVHARDRVGFTNLQRLFSTVQRGSGGAVVFDLDVTAQVRPGYFGAIPSGVLFVENRYTDWHRYWPHQTLRNLWKLSRWVDPRRLRMEWLNPDRNIHLYPNDPLAPSCYRPDTLFATVLFSNPLGWFEVSNLPESFIAAAAPLVRLWRQERAALFGGTIVPIGAAPDGVAWTGLASIAADRQSAHALVFRELNHSPAHAFRVPGIDLTGWQCETLHGRGEARVDEAGRFVAHLPAALDHLWLRLHA